MLGTSGGGEEDVGNRRRPHFDQGWGHGYVYSDRTEQIRLATTPLLVRW